MRLAVAAAALALGGAACMPSRSALFDPVAASVRDRTGLAAEWRAGARRSPATDRRVKEILARPLTAEDAALLAVLVSAELQATYAELGVAGGEAASFRAPRNPELEGEIVFSGGDDAHVELAAVQDVTHLLRLLPGVGGADARLRAARREAVAATVEVAARARIAFHEVAAAEQTLRLRETIAETAAAAASLAKGLREAGNVTELQLTRELLFEEEARLELVDARAAAAAAREELNAVVGLAGEETAWTLVAAPLADPPATPPDVAGLEREAVAASLDLDAMRWRVDANRRDLTVAKLESWLPELGAGVSAKRDGGEWGVGPIVTLSVPLWDWGSGARGAASSRLQAEEHRATALGIRLRATARATAARLAAAHERAAGMRKTILPLRERLAGESVKQYNAMNLDAFELLIVRREHIEAEERYIRAIRDYWIAQAQVDQLRAGSLPSGGVGGGLSSGGGEPEFRKMNGDSHE